MASGRSPHREMGRRRHSLRCRLQVCLPLQQSGRRSGLSYPGQPQPGEGQGRVIRSAYQDCQRSIIEDGGHPIAGRDGRKLAPVVVHFYAGQVRLDRGYSVHSACSVCVPLIGLWGLKSDGTRLLLPRRSHECVREVISTHQSYRVWHVVKL